MYIKYTCTRPYNTPWLIKFEAVAARSLPGKIDVYCRTCRYKVRLYDAQAYGIKKSVYNGTAMAFMWFIIYAVYALAFWYGAKLTRDEPNNYSAGDVLIVSRYFMLCQEYQLENTCVLDTRSFFVWLRGRAWCCIVSPSVARCSSLY